MQSYKYLLLGICWLFTGGCNLYLYFFRYDNNAIYCIIAGLAFINAWKQINLFRLDVLNKLEEN